MAQLSTHVLDLAQGRPAANLQIELYRAGALLHSSVTTTDGRNAAPFPALESGVYELVFHAGDYFRANAVPLSDPPFLDEVVIRFGLSGAAQKVHVPLLLSPYGYSTYRGS